MDYQNTNTQWREINHDSFFSYYAFPQGDGQSCDYATWKFDSPRQLTASERETASFRSSAQLVNSPYKGTYEYRDGKCFALVCGDLPVDVIEFDMKMRRAVNAFTALNCEQVDNSLPEGFSEYHQENAI